MIWEVNENDENKDGKESYFRQLKDMPFAPFQRNGNP